MAKKKENLKADASSLSELQEKLRVLRFNANGSKQKNVKEPKNIKKQIARILTDLNKKK
jgi:ribosomal protein L29